MVRKPPYAIKGTYGGVRGGESPLLDCHRGVMDIILEFGFGTNCINYSWFEGDIFGVLLAIEGILAFFVDATFMAVMT